MVSTLRDAKGNRVTVMTLKKIGIFASTFSAITIALMGWGFSISKEVTRNTAYTETVKQEFLNSEVRIQRDFSHLQGEVRSINKQNVEISSQLTKLIHKQDIRISLLEANLVKITEEEDEG